MDKRIINYILYGILIVVLIGTTLTPMVDKDILWHPENNKPVSFSGISFDKPTNISKLSVTRSLDDLQGIRVINYDVEFEYEGEESSMRIIGDTLSQSFFGSEPPKYSKAVLKGSFDSINDLIFNEKLMYKDKYTVVDDYKFTSTSNIRVPLSAEDGLYKFRLTYKPRELVYGKDKHLGDLSAFLTNARVDKFADINSDDNVHTDSFVHEGMYINIYENLYQSKLNSIERVNNISIGLFILSIIISLGLIWIGQTNQFLIFFLMIITTMNFYRFLKLGINTQGVLILMPIVGVISVLLAKQISKPKLKIDRYDLTQSLLGGVIFLFLGLLVYIVPMVI